VPPNLAESASARQPCRQAPLIILFKNGVRMPDQKDENPNDGQDDPFHHSFFSSLSGTILYQVKV
jgi:hypothetical protein